MTQYSLKTYLIKKYTYIRLNYTIIYIAHKYQYINKYKQHKAVNIINSILNDDILYINTIIYINPNK